MTSLTVTEPSSTKAKSARTSIIKIQYSNVPLNVPVLYPPSVKETEATLETFGNRYVRELNDMNAMERPAGGPYPEIKKHDNQEAIEVITRNTAKLVNNSHKKQKGTMYISELWGSKHLKSVMRSSKLEQVSQTIKEAENEGLREKLEKLEKMYESKEPHIDLGDPEKVIEEFLSKGLNSPRLRRQRMSTNKGERIKSLDKFSLQVEEVQETSRRNKAGSSLTPRPMSSKNLEKEANLLNKIFSGDPKHKSRFYLETQEDDCDPSQRVQTLPVEPMGRKSPNGAGGVSLRVITPTGEKVRVHRNSLKDIGRTPIVKKSKPSLKLPPLIKVEDNSKGSDLGDMSCKTVDSRRDLHRLSPFANNGSPFANNGSPFSQGTSPSGMNGSISGSLSAKNRGEVLKTIGGKPVLFKAKASSSRNLKEM